MVSTEKYLRTFFAVMPKRFEEFRLLKEEKGAIDKRILAGNKLSKNDFARLMEIIGHDTIFHPKSKKKTLKHIVWKLSKSLKGISGIRSRYVEKFEGPYYALKSKKRYAFNPNTSQFDPAVADRLMQSIDRFMEYAEQNASKLLDYLRELDRLYDIEYYELQQCESYDSTTHLDYYKSHLQEEKKLAKSCKSAAVVFQQASSNVIRQGRIFMNYLRSKSGLLKWTKEEGAIGDAIAVSAIILASGAGLAGLTLAWIIGFVLYLITGGIISSLIDVNISELPTWYKWYLPTLEMTSPLLIKSGIDIRKFGNDLLFVTEWLEI